MNIYWFVPIGILLAVLLITTHYFFERYNRRKNLKLRLDKIRKGVYYEKLYFL
jgi:hypothetical protein